MVHRHFLHVSGKILRNPATQNPLTIETTGFLPGKAIASLRVFMRRPTDKKHTKLVLYRENCGGILRNLAIGFRETLLNSDDIDLYEDLRERLFGDERGEREQKDMFAA